MGLGFRRDDEASRDDEGVSCVTAVSAIVVEAVRKSFGATVALDGASFQVEAGEVHALLGENGAGKSTLVKTLSGLVRPDAGRLLLQGQEVHFHSPRDAHRHGLQTAFQELTLVPDLTVAQNMLLPYQPTGFAGQLRDRHGLELVAQHLARMGLAAIDPRRDVRGLDLSLRQKIEIDPGHARLLITESGGYRLMA